MKITNVTKWPNMTLTTAASRTRTNSTIDWAHSPFAILIKPDGHTAAIQRQWHFVAVASVVVFPLSYTVMVSYQKVWPVSDQPHEGPVFDQPKHESDQVVVHS